VCKLLWQIFATLLNNKNKGFFRLKMILKLSQIDIAIFKVFWICKFGKDVRIFAKYDCNSCFVNSFDSDQF